MLGEIHIYSIETPTSPSVTPEGRTVTGSTSVEVRGSVDQTTAAEVALAAQVGQKHDIVCRAPLSIDPEAKAEVVVTDPSHLAGRYKIETIRTLRTHRRIFCSKRGP